MILINTVLLKNIVIKSAFNALLPRCGNCSKRMFRLSNYSRKLADNYSALDLPKKTILNNQFLCKACWLLHNYSKCVKTGKLFLTKDDESTTFLNSQMCKNLSPYHPSSSISGALSPDGLAIIVREHDDLQGRYRNWAGCSKQDYLRTFRIVKEIGLIRENEKHDDPASVEESLKWHCLQIGGNGLIKFFWDKHIRHHEEEYVAGYGKKGNPYYRTRRWTTTDFSGHAVAVLADASRSRNAKR